MHPCSNSGHAQSREVPGGLGEGRRLASPPGKPREPCRRDCRMATPAVLLRAQDFSLGDHTVAPAQLAGSAPRGLRHPPVVASAPAPGHRKRRVTSRGTTRCAGGGSWQTVSGWISAARGPRKRLRRAAAMPSPQRVSQLLDLWVRPGPPSSRPAPAQPAPATPQGTPSPPPSCLPSRRSTGCFCSWVRDLSCPGWGQSCQVGCPAGLPLWPPMGVRTQPWQLLAQAIPGSGLSLTGAKALVQ